MPKEAPETGGRKSHLLIVDDDRRFCYQIEAYLLKMGYHVTVAYSAKEMRGKIERAALVLLDLYLRDVNGLDLTHEIRKQFKEIGIIIMGTDDKLDGIVGLEMGADDYISKPVDERELLARIRALMRRVDPKRQIDRIQSPSARGYRFAGYELDTESYHLIRQDNGEAINLTGHEYNLLVVLLRKPDRVFTRQEISRQITGRDWAPSNRNIDVLVGKLRKKLQVDNGAEIIKTLRGVGYQLGVKVDELQ